MDSKTIYLHQKGVNTGPFTLLEVAQMSQQGELQAFEWICYAPDQGWESLSTLGERLQDLEISGAIAESPTQEIILPSTDSIVPVETEFQFGTAETPPETAQSLPKLSIIGSPARPLYAEFRAYIDQSSESTHFITANPNAVAPNTSPAVVAGAPIAPPTLSPLTAIPPLLSPTPVVQKTLDESVLSAPLVTDRPSLEIPSVGALLDVTAVESLVVTTIPVPSPMAELEQSPNPPVTPAAVIAPVPTLPLVVSMEEPMPTVSSPTTSAVPIPMSEESEPSRLIEVAPKTAADLILGVILYDGRTILSGRLEESQTRRPLFVPEQSVSKSLPDFGTGQSLSVQLPAAGTEAPRRRSARVTHLTKVEGAWAYRLSWA